MTETESQSGQIDPERVLAEIRERFLQRGTAWYAGEQVQQIEHALQAASLAEEDGATSELIAAALLHDYGHLLHNFGEECAEEGIDDHHEGLGAKHLSRYFGPAVTDPIRFHVAAKRYLCAVKPEYLSGLSEASILSLKLQGGPFTPEEAAEFVSRPHAEAAIRLRYWDDRAKVVGLSTPNFAHFEKHLQAALT